MAGDRSEGALKPPRYVEISRPRPGQQYFYYRRDGKRVTKLPPWGVPGSPEHLAFLAAYDRAHTGYERGDHALPRHAVRDAVQGYRGTPDYKGLASATRYNYGLYCDLMNERFGDRAISSITLDYVSTVRDAYSSQPFTFNDLRKVAKLVWDRYGLLHPDACPTNPWDRVKRIAVPKVAPGERQNRAWPPLVLAEVLREATPEFRSVVLCCLLSGQRIGDVCRWAPSAFDAKDGVLRFAQGKTKEPMTLRVGNRMAEVFERMSGRVPGRLLATPRGVAWTEDNAKDTLADMRTRLGLARYTLHGLRSTAATTLRRLGASLDDVMALTGHKEHRTVRLYSAEADNLAVAGPAGERLESHFEQLIADAVTGANQKRFSGVTGRAATKANLASQGKTPTANSLPTAKCAARNLEKT